jgi:hypothetical protein
MKRFFARMVSRATHLSDETISMLVSGELKPSHETHAQTHLAKCWQCRGRRDAFEKAALQVVGYRKARLESELPLDPDRRDLFLAQLDQMLDQSAPASTWSKMLARIRAFRVPNMNPIFASAAIVCIAVIALFWVWQRRPITVNAAQLLRRAETSDLAVTRGKPGVVYQKVRITTSRLKVEHELYRDAQGTRRRPEPVQAKSEPIREVLSSVGVDWEAPLSAASYREWHDLQPSVSDEVLKEDGDLLTLTTKVPNNWIQEETLTVRASDFHPVERTIRTLSYGTIEIAELNYAVLGWNAVNESLFENLKPLMALPHVADVHPALIRALPTPLQIDSAELQARIALNRTGADTQDQVAVTHSDTGVVITGIVPTNERKRQLVSSLRLIPYVHPDIISTEELSARQNSSQPLPTSSSGSQTYSTSQPSPLASYIQTRGLPQERLNQISQRLLDASLTVQQSASRIAELQERFSSSEQLDPQAHASLQGLVAIYSKSITDALDAEVAAMDQVGITPSISSDNQSGEGSLDTTTFKQQVHLNQMLCQELIAASSTTPRSSGAIAADLQLSISRIRAALQAVQKQSR